MRTARVPTGSMMNTIIPGDHIMMQKSFAQIERGQVVVFQFPEDPTYYVSRVIGLPGETIQVRGKEIYINGHVLPEERVMAKEGSSQYGPAYYDPLQEVSTEGNGPYRVFYTAHSKDLSSETFGDFGTHAPLQIPSDSFFLMGDNRDNSLDSRSRGPVPKGMIWGEVSIIYYSEAKTPDGKIRWERVFRKVH